MCLRSYRICCRQCCSCLWSVLGVFAFEIEGPFSDVKWYLLNSLTLNTPSMAESLFLGVYISHPQICIHINQQKSIPYSKTSFALTTLHHSKIVAASYSGVGIVTSKIFPSRDFLVVPSLPFLSVLSHFPCPGSFVFWEWDTPPTFVPFFTSRRW